MNFFRTKIPKDNAQEVTELESWTLSWKIQGDSYGSKIVKHKAFIKEQDAYEYRKQLKEAADFLGTWVDTEINKN